MMGHISGTSCLPDCVHICLYGSLLVLRVFKLFFVFAYNNSSLMYHLLLYNRMVISSRKKKIQSGAGQKLVHGHHKNLANKIIHKNGYLSDQCIQWQSAVAAKELTGEPTRQISNIRLMINIIFLQQSEMQNM